jgi:hypothetical protein
MLGTHPIMRGVRNNFPDARRAGDIAKLTDIMLSILLIRK